MQEQGPPELLERPRDYVVRFSFPQPPELTPPIIGVHGRRASHTHTHTHARARAFLLLTWHTKLVLFSLALRW